MPIGADWRARIGHSALFSLVRGARNELSPIVPLGAAMTVRNVVVLPARPARDRATPNRRDLADIDAGCSVSHPIRQP
jgi:hypothetical protein